MAEKNTRKERAIALLEDFTNAHGAPGNEGPVRDIFAKELASLGDLACDRTGSITCTLESGKEDPTVLLAGHLDEVGFVVQNILPNGFIQFAPLGGWWEHTVLAQRVRIRTRSGNEVLGVTGSMPPHFLSAEARNNTVPIGKMYIDVGAASAGDVHDRLGIRLGDTIVPHSPMTPLNHPDIFVAKAFDNRVGMAVAVQAAQGFASSDVSLPNRTVIAGTAQEEVGTRGAHTITSLVRPDVAILLEGPPADDTQGLNPNESQGALGRGVQIRVMDPSAIMNRSLVDLVIRTAEEESIPHQITVRRSGGTDARTIHLSGQGVPCIVLGIPARYIHSHNSVIQMADYLAALDLTDALVRRLDASTVAGLTDYLQGAFS